MAAGMTRREQMTLLSVVLLVVAGLGYQGYRQAETEDSIYIEGQGRWQKVTEFEAKPREEKPKSQDMAEFSDATMRPLLSVQAASGAGGLDLNTATADELDQALPRIGPAKAAAIIAWRDAHGGFTSVDQLGQVDGIGGKTLESLRPYVRVAAPPPPSAGQPADGVTQNANASPGSAAGIATQPLAQGAAAAQPQGLMAQTSARTAAQPRAWTPEQIAAAQQTLASGPININTANAEQLEQITGVGPVLAQRIIAYRHQYGPFRNLRDLRRVKGIGEQTLLKMLPEITVGQ